MSMPGPSRFHGFLLASAALISAMVVVSGLIVGRFFERHVREHEEKHIVNLVQTEALEHLISADFSPAGRPIAREVIDIFLRELPGVFRVKVYDGTGRIVWSDEPRLIGMSFPDNPSLARALKGEVVTIVGVPKASEHVYERAVGYISETYVPLTFPGSPAVVGVIEAYQDVTGVVVGIRRTQRQIWGIAGGMGLFLFGALALVAWKASVKEQRAMIAIREAHERLAAIMAGIADRMMIVDRQMRVCWMNTAAVEAHGLDAGGAGIPCFQILGAEPEMCQDCPAIRTFLSGQVERGVRVQRLPGGEVRHLDLVTAPLRDASGRVQQVLEVARDITERVELEERLNQSAVRLEESHTALLAKTEELERANQALQEAQVQLVEKERLAAAGQVVVGLHHAILNPLTGILGALQVLKQKELAPAVEVEAFAQAEAEVRQIEEVVRRLSAIRRVTVAAYVGDTTMVDLERSSAEEERV